MGESAKCPCGMPSFLKQDTQHSTLLNKTHGPPLAPTDPGFLKSAAVWLNFRLEFLNSELKLCVCWTARQSFGGTEPQSDSLFRSGKKAKVAK